MPLNLYDRVAVKLALSGQDVRPGDVATLLELVEHPSGGPRGCVLEFFNALGESLRIVTIPESAVESLRADEVLAVRQLAVTDG